MMQLIPAEDMEHVLANTRGLWEQVRGKSLFVTGATGFFGKWLLQSFLYINNRLKLGATLTGLSRDPDRFLSDFPWLRGEDTIKFIKGDLLSFEYPEGKFHFVIHAATETDAAANAGDPLGMLDTLALGTRRVLDFAARNPVESFLFTSSGAVYGKQPEIISHIKESDSFPFCADASAATAYAIGKRLGEVYCSLFFLRYNLPVKIARCFAFVGPYLPLDKHFAIGNFINNALQGEEILVKGDGTPFRSYLYASDLTAWLWTILFSGRNNQAYNVGSDDAYSLESVAALVGRISSSRVRVVKQKDPDRPTEKYIPSIDLVKKELGLNVTVGLTDSIIKTMQFYEDNSRSQGVSGMQSYRS